MASYAGINLLNDMTQLLLYFRSNNFTILSDIKKAFLMIKLSEESDRNRFCFFLKVGEKLLCYRYKTIIFGFNTSPFLLNFIIKHLAKQFPPDQCSNILLNNFYVDNLIMTSNDENDLPYIPYIPSSMKECSKEVLLLDRGRQIALFFVKK